TGASDEFGGYFARLAAHQRKINSQPALPAPSPSASTSTPTPLSSFQRQQAALSSTISSIESQLMNPKPWYHRGEISAAQRPSDSLLDAAVEVEYATKAREVMTREVNEQIEDIIRRRVSESRYDDPRPPPKPK